MGFPLYIHIFGLRIHPHTLMEIIGYAAGCQTYLWLRRRSGKSALFPIDQTAWMLVGCIFGALVGSKLLAWGESPHEFWAHRFEAGVWLGGKTIVGGLLGGWAGVELAKRWIGVRRPTGDLYVFPLIIGIALGRVGCFLTGLSDHTYGIQTSLPWGVDFGDGIFRHPTQVYEIFFLGFLGIWMGLQMRRPEVPGIRFRQFVFAYLVFRFFIEFIKPRYNPYAGLSLIQVASALGVIISSISLTRLLGASARAASLTGEVHV